MRKVMYSEEGRWKKEIVVKNMEEAKTEFLKIRFKYPNSSVGVTFYINKEKPSRFKYIMLFTPRDGLRYWKPVGKDNFEGKKRVIYGWVKGA